MAGVLQHQQLRGGQRRDVGLAIAVEVSDRKHKARSCDGKVQRTFESAISISGENPQRIFSTCRRLHGDGNVCLPVSIKVGDLRLESVKTSSVLFWITEIAVPQSQRDRNTLIIRGDQVQLAIRIEVSQSQPRRL